MTAQSTSKDASLDETTPLLGSSSSIENLKPSSQVNGIQPVSENSPSQDNDEDDDTPLPKVQILVLCLARVIDPMAYFGIFPYINKMIWEIGGMKQEDVGFYSGAIESLFSLTQMCLMIAWGRAADRIGRKPVLVISLSGLAIAISVFGLSTTLWQMVIFRFAAGLFAGSVVTIRAMISENSTRKTQARAFGYFAVGGNIGIFMGPLIGSLANPSDQYPSVFGRVRFFKDFPYALPTFITGAVAAMAAISSVLFLKETLKRGKSAGATPERPMSTWGLIKSPDVLAVLYLYSLVMLLGLAYTAVSPVFWFTKPESGGYGFSPPQISIFLAGIGISQTLWLLVAFPYLQRRFSTRGVLRGCFICWPLIFVSAPVCNIFLRKGWTTAFWIVAPITQIGGSGVAMAFTCVQLALNDVNPTPTTLGTLNAVALTITAAIRTVAPGVFTSIFAASAHTRFLGGYLIWIVLTMLTVVGLISIRWLPEKAWGVIGKKKSVEQDEEPATDDGNTIR